MNLQREIPVPKEPTEAEVVRHRTIDKIEPVVSSELVVDEKAPKRPDGKIPVRPQLKKVLIEKESDLTPELILCGPKRRGEVNCYVLLDGHRYYFSAKTGKALGGEMRPKMVERSGPAGNLVNLGVA